MVSDTGAVGQNSTLWIDADLNRGTGYQIFGSTGGAEYNIEVGGDGIPRLYSGGPVETHIADLEYAYSPDSGILEFRVARFALGNVDQVRVYADINNTAFIPNSYDSVNIFVGEAPPVTVGSTTLDGIVSAGEWSASELLYDSAPGTDPGYRLFGAIEEGANSENTYVLAIDSGIAAIGANTTIWIDSDLNRATGYQIYGSTGGAEYNINIDAEGAARLYTGAAGQIFIANLDYRFAANGSGLEVALPQELLAGNPTAIRVLADVNDQISLPATYAGSNLVIEPQQPPVDPVDDPQVRVGIVYSGTTAANYYNITNYSQLFMAAQNQSGKPRRLRRADLPRVQPRFGKPSRPYSCESRYRSGHLRSRPDRRRQLHDQR
jgi:serralysin